MKPLNRWHKLRFWIFRTYHRFVPYRYGFICGEPGCYFKADSNNVEVIAKISSNHIQAHDNFKES